MKIIKPEWIEHGPKESLSSVHINPNGIRIALAGKYNAVDCIRLFRLTSILNPNDSSQSRLLCRIDAPCPLCVRFSYTSDILAVASRQNVLLYHLTATNPNATNQSIQASSGFGEFPETWRLRSSLSSGHVADVLDIAWCPPNDRYLASCSIDNHICIYAWPSATLLTTLKGHTGLVKGLAWDPTGLLLASQASDGTVRVWSSTTWTCERTIKEPFDNCAESTSFLRLDWSPDGTMFTTAHAKNNSFPVAACVLRDTSNVDAEFVGHRREITCARYFPRILVVNGRRRCLLAIGSKDRTLSLWLTSPRQPMCVLNDLFASGILDISWYLNEDDMSIVLAICSPDGSCAFLSFKQGEIGLPLSLSDMYKFYSDMYKITLTPPKKAMSNGTHVVNGNNHTPVSQPTVTLTLASQTERRLNDGRRCIKPLCIDTPLPTTTEPKQTNTDTSRTLPSTTTTTTTTVRRTPMIPVDPRTFKGPVRSSTSSINLPSSISSTSVFPPLKLQANLIKKLPNQTEFRCEKSDDIYILSCFDDEKKILQWKSIFRSPILTIQATKCFVAIITYHETQHCSELFVLERQSGLRFYSNIILPQTMAGLYISEHDQRATISLVYITGLLTVFQIRRDSMTCPILDLNIAHLLPAHTSIVDIFTMTHLNSDTICLLTSTGDLFGFDSFIKHWTCLFQRHDFVSDFSLPTDLKSSGALALITKTAQDKSNDDCYYSSAHRELLVSAYLESQIHRSRVVQSSKEYSFWLTSFVRFLASSTLEDKSLKLKSILNHLAESLQNKQDNQTLLDQCLTILENHDDTSTLVQHYRQQDAF